MRRALILMLLLVGLVGVNPCFSDDKDNNATGRLLTGKVLDNHGGRTVRAGHRGS